MVKIRLRRMGRRNRPSYRVVVADSRSPRDGKFVEIIGHYDPLTEPATIVINEEQALKWLKSGAQPTDTVRSLLDKLGILGKFQPASGQH
jgi:small subunit ribosomal protein S16